MREIPTWLHQRKQDTHEETLGVSGERLGVDGLARQKQLLAPPVSQVPLP